MHQVYGLLINQKWITNHFHVIHVFIEILKSLFELINQFANKIGASHMFQICEFIECSQ